MTKKTLGWNPTYFGQPKKGSLASVIADITDKQNAVVGDKPHVQSSARVQAEEEKQKQLSQEAVNPAQQAAIAISKKEKGEKPKEEGNAFGAALNAAKEKGDKTFTVGGKEYDVEKEEAKIKETNKNDKSDDGEGLDAVQPKAVKKKFDDRKDKDIDNDGDVDSSDKFLHKKRKAISKAMNKEEVQEETLAMKAAKHIASMWEDSAKAKEAKVKEEEEETPKKKESKTAMTGKPMAGVEVNPKESKDK